MNGLRVTIPDAGNLRAALGLTRHAVASRTALPVLSNILLATESGRLKIAATNLELAITTWIDAVVEREGSITVDARLLGEFVNTLPSGPLDLDMDPARFSLTVRSGRDKAKVNGISSEDFPVIPGIDAGEVSYTIDAQRLLEALRLTEFSAAPDESRPILAGVLTRFEGETLTMASSDGFRMSLSESPLGWDVAERSDLIVPARAYRELAKILGDRDEEITLAITPNRSQVVARVGDVEWVSRIIDGNFPEIKPLIPKVFATSVEVSREALLQAVRRAGYFARENNDLVRLGIRTGPDDLTPGSIEISANAAERGNSESYVDAGVTGLGLEIAFNGKYLTEVLSVMRHGQVWLGLNGANSAGVIRPAGSDAYTHMIMPMIVPGK